MCYVTGGEGGCGSGQAVDRAGTQELEMFVLFAFEETVRPLSMVDYCHTTAPKQAFIEINSVKSNQGHMLMVAG